jgi:GxxExxY protein
MNENEIANRVMGLAIDVHRALGPGLLESTYEECLLYKIKKSGFFAERQKPIPLVFEEVKLECGYRIDILVERKLVLEIKSVEAIHPIFLAQTLTYMRLGGYKLGLLINFNVELLRNGIKRVIHGTLPTAEPIQ